MIWMGHFYEGGATFYVSFPTTAFGQFTNIPWFKVDKAE